MEGEGVFVEVIGGLDDSAFEAVYARIEVSSLVTIPPLVLDPFILEIGGWVLLHGGRGGGEGRLNTVGRGQSSDSMV